MSVKNGETCVTNGNQKLDSPNKSKRALDTEQDTAIEAKLPRIDNADKNGISDKSTGDNTSSKDSEKSTKDAVSLSDFSKFKFRRVLNDNSSKKLIFVEGEFSGSDGAAVVILEKQPFSVETVPQLFTKDTSLDKIFQNDIYGNYMATLPPQLNLVKSTIVHPATEKHIKKYMKEKVYIIEETAELYNTVTKPYVESQPTSIKWVDNILNHVTEQERIVYEDSDEDTGFILLPDLKWDGKTMENLYLVAIIKKHGIKSIRDLNADHIPLLKNIQAKSLKAISDTYGVDAHSLKVYFHYQPSYYHLHVHFTHLQFDGPGASVLGAHLLRTVIENIELSSDYYKNSTLSFTAKRDTPIYNQYTAAGILKEEAAEKEG